ncbi:MAG TPA: sigma-70 family RNA polymerase sigma factor [Allosphingosinicella sp.]
MADDTSRRFAPNELPRFAVEARPSTKDALFADVSAQHSGLISRIALSYEADPALRRDLVQDILLAIWLALDSFRGDSSLKTFIAAIAQKRSISHVTRRAREPRQEALPDHLVSAALSPDEVAVQNDLKKHLISSIQKLPIPQREAIVLCFEGFSYGEMGEVLGISTNAAMLRCQRAKASLKAMMDRRR